MPWLFWLQKITPTYMMIHYGVKHLSWINVFLVKALLLSRFLGVITWLFQIRMLLLNYLISELLMVLITKLNRQLIYPKQQVFVHQLRYRSLTLTDSKSFGEIVLACTHRWIWGKIYSNKEKTFAATNSIQARLLKGPHNRINTG